MSDVSSGSGKELTESWVHRMAEHCSCVRSQVELSDYKLILETAGEMATVRLKLLLVRCYEILRHVSEHPDGTVNLPEGFLQQLRSEVL